MGILSRPELPIIMKKESKILITCALIVSGLVTASCNDSVPDKSTFKPIPEGTALETLTLAAGCFWCVEEIYEHVPGVSEAVSGYSGGKEQFPTYNNVAAGRTSHTEAVEIMYDPNTVNLDHLLNIYWKSFDPTNGRGVAPDFGRQYRPVLFYRTEEEKQIMEASKQALALELKEDIAVEIVPFEKFWKAEDYHQDYAENNPGNFYIKSISIPRMKRTFKKLAAENKS